ncbi:MAG: VWA domain-containing protein [Saprospiraceae bacterium]
MYKFILILAIITLAQCKSNKAVTTLPTGESTSTAVINDTTIIEKTYLYRGDSLTTYITMVGDTILSKRTSKLRNGGETDMVTARRSMKKTSSMPEMEDAVFKSAESGATAMPSPRGRIKPGIPQNPDSGQLTAGEWNDLNNWDDWNNLLNNNDYFSMQDAWGIYPTERYSVFVTNDDNIPLADLRVELRDGNTVVWKAKTDHSGRTELWSGLTIKGRRAKEKLTARIYHKGQAHNIEVKKGGSSHLSIPNSCNTVSAVDIMFVVDATGSMGDEINYLKSEVKDVIKRATKSQNELEIRVGSVFYRDSNDAYLTKVSPLNSDLDKVYDFIGKQGASGGGDYPEAVEAALEEALAQKWSKNAVTRIIFLLLDAPPHDEDQVKSTIKDQIMEAAEIGIKIIPISASGINRETEFLLKFMSIVTNGTYVFITDDSGIGRAHLDPVVSDFEVEKLNDLMTRLITHYTTINSCEEKIMINKDVKIYPNPTSNYIRIESGLNLKEIRIISSTGKVMFKTTAVSEIERIDLSQYVDGMYTVQCIGEDFSYNYPVIKVSQ